MEDPQIQALDAITTLAFTSHATTSPDADSRTASTSY
jgi:hypothetical protein